MPYLEELARPGIDVVFPVHYSVESSLLLRDFWTPSEIGSKASAVGKDLMARCTWVVHKRLADGRISSARQYLESLGAEMSVDLWAGNFRRLTESYSTNGQARMLVKKSGSLFSLNAIAGRLRRVFRRLSIPLLPLVLLHDLDQGADTGF